MRLTTNSLSLIASTAVLLAIQCIGFAGALSVEQVKQIMDQRWQQSKPESITKRSVVFQDIRAAGNGRFLVSAIVHDYNSGYPPNHYYGNTCLLRFENLDTSIINDGTKWAVNANFANYQRECKTNTSQGVSAIPVASLPGSSAATGVVTSGPAPTSYSPKQGAYGCWSGNRSQLRFNFSIRGGGQYTDSVGAAGAFRFDNNNQRIEFQGGLLSNLGAGYYAIYYEPEGLPTVSMRNSKGEEAVFCQKR